MAIAQNHVINIQPGVSAPLVIHCSQGDTGTQINLTVVNGDEEFDCSSYACSVHGTRSDRANWGPFTCNVSGSTVSFSLTSGMTAVAGSCLAEVSIGTVGTANFALLVENATFENGVTYSNDVSVYQNILNAVQAGLSLAEAAVTNEKNERIAAVNAEATARQTANNILQGNINSEAATRASADSNLQSQINQIIAPSGEAPSAAEVQNARIGADGVTYDTLGNAIRGQVTYLKNALDTSSGSLNGEVFADGNIPKVGSTINGYGIGTDGIRYTDSNKQIVRYDISNVKLLHITLKTADDTYVFQNDITLPDQSTPNSYIVGTPYKGICDSVVEIPDGAVCVFITQAKTLPDSVVYTFSNIDALFDDASYAPYYFASFEFGNLDISNSGWGISAYHQDKRIRINPNNPLKLLKGDIIKFTQNNIYFNVGYRVDGVYSDATSWITGEYVCPVDGEYVFCMRYLNETTLESVNELAQYCRICRVNSPAYQDIKSLQDNASYDLPSYYTETWMDNMIASIRDKSKILNGVCFAFITDLHFSANSLNSKYLLKAVLDNTPVPFVIAGGDFAHANGTEDVLHETYDNLMSYVESVGQNNWFAMVGNHDFKVEDTSVSPAITHYATWGEAYNYIFRKSERNVLNADIDYGCYVIKNDAQKTKIIILNSCEVEPIASDTLTYGAGRVSTAQINWFCEELLKDSGYKIIVMSHIPSDSSTQGYSSSQDKIQNVLIAFNNKGVYDNISFADTTNELICHITGHTHNDQSHTDNGVLSITTTCDAHYADDGHGATAGTVTEQAFDVFCFDYDAGTINAVRVGRGASRAWEIVNGVWTQIA